METAIKYEFYFITKDSYLKYDESDKTVAGETICNAFKDKVHPFQSSLRKHCLQKIDSKNYKTFGQKVDKIPEHIKEEIFYKYFCLSDLSGVINTKNNFGFLYYYDNIIGNENRFRVFICPKEHFLKKHKVQINFMNGFYEIYFKNLDELELMEWMLSGENKGNPKIITLEEKYPYVGKNKFIKYTIKTLKQ